MKSAGWTTVGLQDSVHRRRCPETHRRIEVVFAETRRLARRVRDAGLHADAVTDGEFGHVGACLYDDTRAFVPEDHRGAHNELADGAVRVIVDVAAADADGVQLDPHAARPDPVVSFDVAERKFKLLFQDECFCHVLTLLTALDDEHAEDDGDRRRNV